MADYLKVRKKHFMSIVARMKEQEICPIRKDPCKSLWVWSDELDRAYDKLCEMEGGKL